MLINEVCGSGRLSSQETLKNPIFFQISNTPNFNSSILFLLHRASTPFTSRISFKRPHSTFQRPYCLRGTVYSLDVRTSFQRPYTPFGGPYTPFPLRAVYLLREAVYSFQRPYTTPFPGRVLSIISSHS